MKFSLDTQALSEIETILKRVAETNGIENISSIKIALTSDTGMVFFTREATTKDREEGLRALELWRSIHNKKKKNIFESTDPNRYPSDYFESKKNVPVPESLTLKGWLKEQEEKAVKEPFKLEDIYYEDLDTGKISDKPPKK